MTSSERLFNLLDVQPESLDKPNPIHVDSFNGKIEFRNVWFAYKEDEWILETSLLLSNLSKRLLLSVRLARQNNNSFTHCRITKSKRTNSH